MFCCSCVSCHSSTFKYLLKSLHLPVGRQPLLLALQVWHFHPGLSLEGMELGGHWDWGICLVVARWLSPTCFFLLIRIRLRFFFMLLIVVITKLDKKAGYVGRRYSCRCWEKLAAASVILRFVLPLSRCCVCEYCFCGALSTAVGCGWVVHK